MLEILGKIGFDWQVALANLINFFIVFLLLKKFFFKKIKETIRERRNKIEKGLEDAEKAAESLKSAEIEKDSIVKEALKIIFNIPDPLPGKSNIYGIKKDSHAWQALAVAGYFANI